MIFLLAIIIILCIIAIQLYNKNNNSEKYLYGGGDNRPCWAVERSDTKYKYISNSLLEKSETINVLMIGNSFVYKNSMWKTLQTLLGSKYNIDRAAAPSLSLKQHREQGDLVPILTSKRYDYIILQEKSIIPMKYPERLSNNITKTIEYINKYQPQGWIPILYETYSRCYKYDPNPDITQQIISAAYEKAGLDNKCPVAKVGDSFIKFRLLDSFDITDPILLKCTEKDNIHPTDMGSLLTSLVFYKMLTGKSAQTAPIPAPQGRLRESILGDQLATTFIDIVDSL